ncbi:MAG: hypothetical protein ACR2NP_12790 [Pirellulaceae bacterium]
MKNVAMVTGLLLIVIGMAGYLMPSETVTDGDRAVGIGAEVQKSFDGPVVEKKRSVTALIPAFAGLPILLCGLVAAAKPESTKMSMHIAVTLGLLGALAATSRGVMSLFKMMGGEDVNQRALLFLVSMAVICWIFVILCVWSFIQARKANAEGQAKEAG